MGIISRGQVADVMEETISMRKGSVMGWKQTKSDEQTNETARSHVEGEMLILMFSTLLIKYFKNSSHLVRDISKVGLGAGRITELIDLNRMLTSTSLLRGGLVAGQNKNGKGREDAGRFILKSLAIVLA